MICSKNQVNTSYPIFCRHICFAKNSNFTKLQWDLRGKFSLILRPGGIKLRVFILRWNSTQSIVAISASELVILVPTHERNCRVFCAQHLNGSKIDTGAGICPFEWSWVYIVHQILGMFHFNVNDHSKRRSSYGWISKKEIQY
jgi:hypothetical protein